MCGFVGFTAVDYDREANQAIVKDMSDRIAHRGPDDEGFFVDDVWIWGFHRRPWGLRDGGVSYRRI